MHDWLSMGLTAVGFRLVILGIMKRRRRLRTLVPAGAIRPEFAAMGATIRPLVLFVVAIFALKMTLFYFVFGGRRYLTPLDFAAVLFVLAAYALYLVLATTRPPVVAEAEPAGVRSTA
jgi:hypothetical protein